MKVNKVVSMGVGYARKSEYEYEGVKYEADIKDGDIITIVDAGQITMGQYGEQHVFKIKTRNGEKAITLNQTTMNNLIDAYGDETKEWVGKEVKVWLIKALVSGKMQKVTYLSDQSWEMNDEGKFLSPEKADVDIAGSDEDDINFDDPNKM